MALNLASPGILVREVDLTIGRIDGSTGKIGGIVGPFEKGPVDVPVTITGENEYVDQFGKPYEVDKHYETWMVGSSYLAYGGVLSVIRADDTGLKNAVGGGTSTSVKIKSTDHYKELGYDENTFDGVYAHVDLKANVPVGPGDTVRVLGDKIVAPYGSKFTLFRTAEVQRAGRVERAWTKLTGRLECLELLEVSFSAGDA